MKFLTFNDNEKKKKLKNNYFCIGTNALHLYTQNWPNWVRPMVYFPSPTVRNRRHVENDIRTGQADCDTSQPPALGLIESLMVALGLIVLDGFFFQEYEPI